MPTIEEQLKAFDDRLRRLYYDRGRRIAARDAAIQARQATCNAAITTIRNEFAAAQEADDREIAALTEKKNGMVELKE